MASHRMPRRQSKHVVPVHAVAKMLGWRAARLHRVDDILRPFQSAAGSLYDVDRVLFFVRVFDNVG